MVPGFWTPRFLNNSRFIVRKSTIKGAGLGLFAGKYLKKGSELKVNGVLIRRGSAADRFTHYADRHKFRVGGHVLMPTGFAGMANHSFAPNMEKKIRGKLVYLKALRSVAKGEELFFTYANWRK